MCNVLDEMGKVVSKCVQHEVGERREVGRIWFIGG